MLVWWSREEGRAPLEGGKGDRRGGGAGRPKKPLRPPPALAQREAIENWGGLGVTADMRRGGLGHREKAIGSQATRVSVPQCVCSRSRETRAGRWWQERRKEKEGADAEVSVGEETRVLAWGMVGSVSTEPAPWLSG